VVKDQQFPHLQYMAELYLMEQITLGVNRGEWRTRHCKTWWKCITFLQVLSI